ATLDEFVNTER
nr:glucoamylase A1 {N-terminal} [Chalara paradoxa, Peptide Partial, 11 aa] [Thielaviopsis paradoxa]